MSTNKIAALAVLTMAAVCGMAVWSVKAHAQGENAMCLLVGAENQNTLVFTGQDAPARKGKRVAVVVDNESSRIVNSGYWSMTEGGNALVEYVTGEWFAYAVRGNAVPCSF